MAGTVFHKLRQPLVILFWAVYLIATTKKGLSALELQRKLGLKSYRTAWTLLHKIRSAMASSQAFPLTGTVEVDEIYILVVVVPGNAVAEQKGSRSSQP
jgi:hypothetical protein